MYPIWSIGHIFYKWPTKQCWWWEVCVQFKTFYISGWSCKDPVEVHLFWLSTITTTAATAASQQSLNYLKTMVELHQFMGVSLPMCQGDLGLGFKVYHIFSRFSPILYFFLRILIIAKAWLDIWRRSCM